MKNMAKKVIIYSLLAGITQFGLSAAVIEASPLLHTDGQQRIMQLDNRQQHDERQRQENERHSREMQRHHNESERDWHNRQNKEQQRHDNTMNEIAAGLVGIVIGSAIS